MKGKHKKTVITISIILLLYIGLHFCGFCGFYKWSPAFKVRMPNGIVGNELIRYYDWKLKDWNLALYTDFKYGH